MFEKIEKENNMLLKYKNLNNIKIYLLDANKVFKKY
jgi:hypothetical protein